MWVITGFNFFIEHIGSLLIIYERHFDWEIFLFVISKVIIFTIVFSTSIYGYSNMTNNNNNHDDDDDKNDNRKWEKQR